jgi:hypothetical protein
MLTVSRNTRVKSSAPFPRVLNLRDPMNQRLVGGLPPAVIGASVVPASSASSDSDPANAHPPLWKWPKPTSSPEKTPRDSFVTTPIALPDKRLYGMS